MDDKAVQRGNVERFVAACLRERLGPVVAFDADTSLEALGLQLNDVLLIGYALREELGVDVDEWALYGAETVGQLVDVIGGSLPPSVPRAREADG